MPTVIEELQSSDDPVDRDVAVTLLEWQAAKRAGGRAASMGREPREIRERGAVEVISRRVRDRATGFAEVEARHSYEAIVERYPNRFDSEIVQIARQRLEQWRSKHSAISKDRHT